MRKIKITKTELEQLYLIEDKPISEIADIYNCNRSTIRRLIDRYNIPKKTKTIQDIPIATTILGQKIQQLRGNKLSYRDIAKILNCSYVTVVRNCNSNFLANCNNKLKAHPYILKTVAFKSKYTKPIRGNTKRIYTYKDLLRNKVQNFHNRLRVIDMNFNYKDVIKKFGEKPICYLTGKVINIYEPTTYSFDHIIPQSRGGESTLDNLGICTREANQAKSDKTPEEFMSFCKQLLEHNGFTVTKD